ncbi:16S rRNA (uracil1498-N3)-methyltransferase [Noviherbaspirillum humi]|uniref:Ribosomal RNA small subunit methyltransferase E n=1 Tax=Noviherbaspirillum humi TaxID=1688639 RepID=A0A239GKD0_9BURK|nr:16S rRNA (uracil(1498)-N(3))-methyltransferase [Noviherbaspirillum humi]SNS69619.1 16S rRNA (uracil1498-N3)-methyltransferase [Noviherbaspirillum humi]
MPRFHFPHPLAPGDSIALPEPVAHHLHVLRMKAGDGITLFNGQGGEYAAVLTAVERKRAQAEVKVFSPREAEPAHCLTLAQALPEGSKMDWIIEKAVELGVTAIQPLHARRCVVRLSAERAARKIEHWAAVAVAACEQSGRNRVPAVTEPADFESWVARHDMHARLLLTPRAEMSLADWARHQPAQALTLMIGPEGGFSPEEEALALAGGAIGVHMGSRILRTETAGLAAAAMLNALWPE